MMRKIASFILISMLALGVSGCGWLSDRGDDALEMFDIGITITDSWAPQFAIYMDYFQFTPIGYSNFDGKFLGIGNTQIGWMDARVKAWGVLASGIEDVQHGVFDPTDPRQARKGFQGERRPAYYTGILPPKSLGQKCPPLQYAECCRIFHFGWIGFEMACRPLDWFDFLLGWVGIDYMDDDAWANSRDDAPPKVRKPAPPSEPVAARRADSPPLLESQAQRFRREEMEHARGEPVPKYEYHDSQREKAEARRRARREPREKKGVMGALKGMVRWMRDVEDWVWNHM